VNNWAKAQLFFFIFIARWLKPTAKDSPIAKYTVSSEHYLSFEKANGKG
jgi:hypothetical protein